MGDQNAPVETEAIAPDRVGWLKRSHIGPRVWEQPDGQLFQFPPGRPETLVVLKDSPLLGNEGRKED
jgi:hypothetical protein